MLTVLCADDLRPQMATRVAVCRGVTILPTDGRADYPAIVPVDRWQPVPEHELKAILGEWRDGLSGGDYVGLFGLRPEAATLMRHFATWYHSGPAKRTAECRAKVAALGLFEAIYDHCGTTDPETFRGVARMEPNMSCVTVDPATDTLVGLHLDTFDRLAIAECRAGRNRISVNIGSQDRYFLFVPRQAHDLLDQLASSGLLEPHEVSQLWTDQRALVWQYFRAFPGTEILRLRVRPGEAYIAPTENIVHDGSTLGCSHYDWTAVWFGHLTWANVRGFGTGHITCS